jgi:hypothetical protein
MAEDRSPEPNPRYKPRPDAGSEEQQYGASWFPGPDHRAAEYRVAWRRLASEPDADRLLDGAIAWIRQKWGEERPCPYCGDSMWEVGMPFELAQAPSGAMALAFPVICSNCGNTTLVNAGRAGLVEDRS